jgi:hypothetical protein
MTEITPLLIVGLASVNRGPESGEKTLQIKSVNRQGSIAPREGHSWFEHILMPGVNKPYPAFHDALCLNTRIIKPRTRHVSCFCYSLQDMEQSRETNLLRRHPRVKLLAGLDSSSFPLTIDLVTANRYSLAIL